MKFRTLLLLFAATLLFPNAKAAKQVVTCVGNSITIGYGLTLTDSYPGQLQTLLGSTNWTVGNYGVSSRTMLKNGNYPYWNETAYANALASNPNYVIIELGTNDTKDINWKPYGSQFKGDCIAMIKSFRALSTKPTVILNLCPPGNNIGWSIRNTGIRDTINPIIKQVAIENGYPLIDMYALFKGNYVTYFQSDYVHPTKAGAGLMAQKVNEFLNLAKPTLTLNNGKLAFSNTSYDTQWYRNDTMISQANGGKDTQLTLTLRGRYKVSIKLTDTTETRIVSEDYKYLYSNALDSLSTAINNANVQKSNMTSGANPGYYLPAVITDFSQKINNANTTFNTLGLPDATYKIAADSLIAQTARYKLMRNLPLVSTSTTNYWYTLYTPLRNTNANNVVAFQGNNVNLIGEVYASNTPKQQWKLTKNNDGTYNIINRVAGSYIDKNSASGFALKAQASSGTPTSGGWSITLIPNTTSFIFTSGTVQLNQTSSYYSYAVFNWGSGINTTDVGCQYDLRLEQTENLSSSVPPTSFSTVKVWVKNRRLCTNFNSKAIKLYTVDGKEINPKQILPIGVVFVEIDHERFKVQVQ